MGLCSSKASIVDAPGPVAIDASGTPVVVVEDVSGTLCAIVDVSSPVAVDEPSSPDSTIVSAPVTPILSFEALDTLIQKVDVVLASKTNEPAKTIESAKTIEPAKPVFGAPMSRASSS